MSFPALLQDGVLNDCILDLDIVAFNITVDTSEGGFSFLVLVTFSVVSWQRTVSATHARGRAKKDPIYYSPGVSGSQRKIGNMMPKKPHWVRIGVM
jgi:hypothetical protein